LLNSFNCLLKFSRLSVKTIDQSLTVVTTAVYIAGAFSKEKEEKNV